MGKRDGRKSGGLQIPEVTSVHAHLPPLRQLEFPLQSILKLDPEESFCTKEKKSQMVFTGLGIIKEQEEQVQNPLRQLQGGTGRVEQTEQTVWWLLDVPLHYLIKSGSFGEKQ